MIEGVYSIANSKLVNTRRMEMIANNIANAMTPGFKTMKPLAMLRKMSDIENTGAMLEQTHVEIEESYNDFSNGSLVETGSSLDLAIRGEGFFVVNSPNGTRFTRNGKLLMNKENNLVTSDGYPLQGTGGNITIKGDQGNDIKIEKDGSIFVDKELIDKIRIVDFEDKTVLKNEGKTLLVADENDSVEVSTDKFSVVQGNLEMSNVNVMSEMVDMISVLRAYEACTKVEQQFSELNSKLINMGRY